MDALRQLAPVASTLLREVDRALMTLGAPAVHPVWRVLGRVGATPSDVVAFVADLEPSRLHAAASALREQAAAYEQASIPVETPAEGATAEHYSAAATAAREHLSGQGASLAARLRSQASYVESVADWQQALRDDLARRLAEVMTSGQAVTLRSRATSSTEAGGLSAAVAAAAEIAVALLAVAEDAAAAGRDVILGGGELDELPYRAMLPSESMSEFPTIRLG